MKLSSILVAELSRELQNGFDIYVNLDTGETKSLMDESLSGSVRQEYSFQEFNEIKNNWTQFLKISKPDPFEEYGYKENFINQVSNPEIREKLSEVLKNRNPLSDFSQIAEISELRDEWSYYIQNCYLEYLKRQLDIYGITVEQNY